MNLKILKNLTVFNKQMFPKVSFAWSIDKLRKDAQNRWYSSFLHRKVTAQLFKMFFGVHFQALAIIHIHLHKASCLLVKLVCLLLLFSAAWSLARNITHKIYSIATKPGVTNIK